MDAITRRRLVETLAELDGVRTGAPPDLRDAPLIDDWSVFRSGDASFLVGRVTGHPNIADGHLARTSLLVAMDGARSWARTLSRFYSLGAPTQDRRDED